MKQGYCQYNQELYLETEQYTTNFGENETADGLEGNIAVRVNAYQPFAVICWLIISLHYICNLYYINPNMHVHISFHITKRPQHHDNPYQILLIITYLDVPHILLCIISNIYNTVNISKGTVCIRNQSILNRNLETSTEQCQSSTLALKGAIRLSIPYCRNWE